MDAFSLSIALPVIAAGTASVVARILTASHHTTADATLQPGGGAAIAASSTLGRAVWTRIGRGGI
jgi:hypothetical protein